MLPLELAQEHWEWHKKFLKEVYDVSDDDLRKFGRIAIDYFVHGYEHHQKEIEKEKGAK